MLNHCDDRGSADGQPCLPALLEHAPDVIAVVDRAGVVCYMSPSVEWVLGRPPADFVGGSAFEHVHPEDVDAARHTFVHGWAVPGVHAPARFRLRNRQGAWRWFEAIANNRLDDPCIRGLVVSAREVTASVAAEEMIRFQAGLLDAVGQAVLAADLSGRVTYWNPAAERLYGYTAAEIVGHSLAVLAPPERPAELPELLERLGRGESVEAAETVRLHKSGRRLDVLVSFSPIRDALGRVVGGACVAHDISDRKRLDRERAALYRTLLDREQQLQRLMEQLLLDREERLRQAEPKLARLSPREQQVLKLLAEGKTNRQIAEVLGCRPLTARNHVDHLLAKLELSDRTQAAVWAAQRGLLGPAR